jgi:hypothetical protein
VSPPLVLSAFRDRAIKGGSYQVVGSLTKYDMFHVSKFGGTYPEEVVKQVSRRFLSTRCGDLG